MAERPLVEEGMQWGGALINSGNKLALMVVAVAHTWLRRRPQPQRLAKLKKRGRGGGEAVRA